MKKINRNKKGFALLMAIFTTSILLLVSFVIANIALKQLVITYSSKQSQIAFYAAESGIEFATYEDIKKGPPSPFSTSTPGEIIWHTIRTPVGGDGDGSTSSFRLYLADGCVDVIVEKESDPNYGKTLIKAQGFNDCSPTALRRFQRGISIEY